MRDAILCLATALLALTSASSCSLLTSQDIPFDVPAQELDQNVSQAFTQPGTLPSIDCTSNESLCSTMMPSGLPASATISCDAATGSSSGTKQCVLHFDLTVNVTIDLSKEASFPSAVTSSPAVSLVTLNTVKYWAGSSNKVNVATPPLDIFVGPQTATTSTAPGVQQLGTIPSIPAMMAPSASPDCNGPGTSSASACSLQLTPAGQSLFETLAKSFQTPFNLILVGHLTVAGGMPFPQGTMDLFLQPQLAFHL
jgi:hypothetical protein